MTITAKVICDSISTDGIRLSTLQLRYPKFIHAEFMTHRVFSRNASSSRAIPVERLIKDVMNDPAYPTSFGRNKRGMQAGEEIDELIEYDGLGKLSCREVWDLAREDAVGSAKIFARAGVHKQVVNRLLEPFCHINVVVTATEWDNFLALRCHPDAQPEMQDLAMKMREALNASDPQLLRQGEWHLPYAPSDDGCGHKIKWDEILDNVVIAIQVSVARCARVSYLTQDGRIPTIEEDLALYDRLVGSRPLHASPAEHQATPDPMEERPDLHGNLRGWCQFRKMLSWECQA
jgi:thymidylate synthase ThyX